MNTDETEKAANLEKNNNRIQQMNNKNQETILKYATSVIILQKQSNELNKKETTKNTVTTNLKKQKFSIFNLSASLSSLSLSTSANIECFDRHKKAVNINLTNTKEANQFNLQLEKTTKMPTQTSTKVKLPNTATITTASKTFTSKMTNKLETQLNLEAISEKSSHFNNSSARISKESYSPFRRSYSVPLLKIDDVACERESALDAQVKCDKRNLNLTATDTKNENFIYEFNGTSSTTTPTTNSKRTTIEIKLTSTDACKTAEHHNEVCNNQEKLRFGCAHYKRRAMFVTPCCKKFYKCRFCHDENETHHFDRKTLNELICSECDTRQKVQEACVNCGVRFGKYICLICNLFDDEDKKQYHCDACGICRIGGAENFFHCKVCNMCLPVQLKIDGHKCVENISRSHCPVCLGDIHTSRIPCHIPDCGHLLHKMCFDQLLASGHYVCPICQTSLIDMTALWDFLDAQVSHMPMPNKYENQRIHIFCNDCQRTSKTNFHFIGLKCMECGAYNTTQDVKRRVSLVPDEPTTA